VYTQFVNMTAWSGSIYYTQMTTPLHHNKMISFLRGISINSWGGNVKNIQILKNVYNSTYWNFTIVKPPRMYIDFIQLTLVAYSSNHMDVSPFTMQWGGSINSTRLGMSDYNGTSVQPPMMLYGLNFFEAVNDNSTLSYALTSNWTQPTSTTATTTLNVSSLIPSIATKTPINTIAVDYLFVLLPSCYSGCQYYMLGSMTCYDVCPSNTVKINQNACGPCAY
jgi:hypothetical protein